MRFIPKGLTPANLAIGAGVVLVAPVVLPLVGEVAKPVAKAVVKGALMTYEGVKVALVEAKESLEDITAEAKAEVAKKAAEKEE